MGKESFAGKKILVMGLGRFGGGLDTTEFMHDAGARVTVTDLADAEQLRKSLNQLARYPYIEYHLGGHNESDFKQTDIVVANPAVPPDNRYLAIAEKAGAQITSQIEFFFRLCPALIIAVTGSNGKSTTSALTAHLLRAAGNKDVRKYNDVWLSGNIGTEPLLMLLAKIAADDLVVLELSSFQLEQLAAAALAPKFALLTNLVPNHLDRYITFENYCRAKENIFKLQRCDSVSKAVSVFNIDDEIVSQLFEKYNRQPGRVSLKYSASDVPPQMCENFTLPGRVNISNLAAAMTIAKYFGVGDTDIRNSLGRFKPLPHRLELITRKSGVSWYNDSKATTPQSTIAAIEAFSRPQGGHPAEIRKKPSLIIIVGGYDKGLCFDELALKMAQKTKAIILIGRCAEKIKRSVENAPVGTTGPASIVVKADSLAQAVETANTIADSSDIVLFSPACASYDMFDNFRQRGEKFRELIHALPVTDKSGKKR